MDVNEFLVDKSIRPQDDFYLFVNKRWLDENPIPDEYSSWSYWTILRKENFKKIRDLLEGNFQQSDFMKVAEFYQSGMDSKRIEEEGLKPLQPFLDQIDNIKNYEDIQSFIIQTLQFNTTSIYSNFSLVALFLLGSYPDSKNTKEEIIYLISAGLGLPDRDYYLKEDFQNVKQEYHEYIKNLFLLLNKNIDNSTSNADSILSLETELANVTYTNVQRMNIELQYNKITFHELEEKFYNFNWKKLFKDNFQIDIPYLSIDNFGFYTKLFELLSNKDKLDAWKAYFTFKIISNSAPYLNDKFFNAYFNFFGKILLGKQKPELRYERIINLMDLTVGELIGKVFVSKYFPQSSKDKMLQLVDNLKETLEERIENLNWMTQETKEKALKKLHTFQAKIGYPDTWNDFTDIDLSENYSFLKNALNSRKFKFKIEMKNNYQQPDINKWEMSAYTINAYFQFWKNEIVFPAGILQNPFFDPQAHDSINYGGIGCVIGHEMTHGYDDQGSKFDEKGELHNWWREEDLNAFKHKSKYFIDEYNKYKVKGISLNGDLTLGENLADYGGVKIAYYALQKHYQKEGYPTYNSEWSPEQEFFLSNARVWCTNIRDEAVSVQIQTDAHSPAEWRIKGTLANIEEFHKAFNVKVGDKLFRSEIENIW